LERKIKDDGRFRFGNRGGHGVHPQISIIVSPAITFLYSLDLVMVKNIRRGENVFGIRSFLELSGSYF